MSNAERILNRLDQLLDVDVDVTLYGRAALLLGYANPKTDTGFRRDP